MVDGTIGWRWWRRRATFVRSPPPMNFLDFGRCTRLGQDVDDDHLSRKPLKLYAVDHHFLYRSLRLLIRLSRPPKWQHHHRRWRPLYLGNVVVAKWTLDSMMLLKSERGRRQELCRSIKEFHLCERNVDEKIYNSVMK